MSWKTRTRCGGRSQNYCVGKDLASWKRADGTTAIDLLRGTTGTIDAMLLDMTIPGATSLHVGHEAQRLRPAMRIILTSAYGPDVAQQSFGGAQPGPFLRKPYQVCDLVPLLTQPPGTPQQKVT